MGVKFELLNQSQTILRLDVLPFLFLYFILLCWYIKIEEEPIIEENTIMKKIKKETFENVQDTTPEVIIESMESIYARLIFIAVVFLHSLIYLSSYWSTHIKAIIRYSSGGSTITTNQLIQYKYIKATYKKHSISYSDIVPIIRYESESFGVGYRIKFMENDFVFNSGNGLFERVKPDVKFDLNAIDTKDFRTVVTTKNTMLIPMKKFNEVLKEQLMEPFSFFQIFSVSLWLLDESRIYALFTLSMLFVTACTVVLQRMKTMLTLRQMKLNPQYITVYRNRNWVKISSEELVPGDICILHTAEQAKPVIAAKVDPSAIQLSEEEQFLKEQIPFSSHLPPKLFKTENLNTDSYKSIPCDMLLLNGTVVINEAMLTGESVPQVKDSIEMIKHSEHLDIKNKHKSSIIYCGTEVLQVQSNKNYPKHIQFADQNAHCLALVLRTGFDTAKGKLIKTVFYNNENAQVKQMDGYVIVAFLLIFALISSAYVLINGLDNETRDKNKLFLRCILIITTVVPPELPMILSIAVNQSLAFLQMRKIFCTEPFRIPWAGKVEVLAFDKTGTLTNDTLLFTGIIDSPGIQLKSKTECNLECQRILAGCHQLVYADSKLQGDPVELLFLQNNSQWNYQAQWKSAVHKDTQTSVTQRVTFPFKSDLKRMSSLVEIEQKGQKSLKLIVKGAPESIESLLVHVPADFKKQYQHFAYQGYRVLCLADRDVNPEDFGLQSDYNNNVASLMQMDREIFETKLHFRGLLICESPLKKDTITWISKFKASYFQPIIITGDNMLTAIAVAEQLKLNQHEQQVALPTYTLEYQQKQYQLREYKTDKDTPVKNLLTEISNISKSAMLCMPSSTLSQLVDEGYPQLNQLLCYFVVFARMSPKQKETIITGIKRSGKGILMCGDGTNDVGALKKAHVGIALVTNQGEEQKEDDEEEEEQMAQMSFTQQLQAVKKKQEEQRKLMQEAKGNPERIRNLAKQQMNEATSSMFDMGPSYKFGDACIAAPFTSKMSTSIRCVHTILKQGVCTLVTTICTYKIMALQSILSAYSLSALHMQSLKMSETQMTLMGILGAGYYFCYSSAKPQRNLSKVKPSFSIFEFNFVFSLITQAILHLYAMDYAIHHIAKEYMSIAEHEITNDVEFKPTFQNTVVFLLQLLQQSCIFMFNHPGEPHMQKLDPKSKFFKSLFIPLGLCIVASFNYSEDLNYYFDLTFPDNSDASYKLSQLCIVVTLINYGIERFVKYVKYGKFYGFI